MKRLSLLLGAVVTGITLFTASAQAASLSGLPPEIAKAIDDLQATMYPPTIDTVEAGAAAANAPVTIKAKFKKSHEKGEAAESAKLFYSTDACKTWKSVDMKGSGDTYSGDIPGHASGTKVNYIVTARDVHENLYTEISCEATAEGDSIKADAGGWHPVAGNEGEPDGTPDVGDPSDADLNLMEPWVAMNSEFIYFNMTVKGKIGPGTTSPMKIHAHAAGLLNRDMGDDDLLKGFVMVYAPLAKLASYPPCLLVYEKGGAANMDDKNIKCVVNGNSLVYRMPRSLYGKNDTGQIKTMMVTGAITAISPLAGRVKDHSRISLINLNAKRNYSVP